MAYLSYKALSHSPARLATILIKGYQLFLSPILSSGCRFQPTCSSYAIDAFTQFGVAKGAWLSLRRIARCHPWGNAGFDPVPKHVHKKAELPSCHNSSLR